MTQSSFYDETTLWIIFVYFYRNRSISGRYVTVWYLSTRKVFLWIRLWPIQSWFVHSSSITYANSSTCRIGAKCTIFCVGPELNCLVLQSWTAIQPIRLNIRWSNRRIMWKSTVSLSVMDRWIFKLNFLLTQVSSLINRSSRNPFQPRITTFTFTTRRYTRCV